MIFLIHMLSLKFISHLTANSEFNYYDLTLLFELSRKGRLIFENPSDRRARPA
jgi:hypothetical protein